MILTHKQRCRLARARHKSDLESAEIASKKHVQYSNERHFDRQEHLDPGLISAFNDLHDEQPDPAYRPDHVIDSIDFEFYQGDYFNY